MCNYWVKNNLEKNAEHSLQASWSEQPNLSENKFIFLSRNVMNCFGDIHDTYMNK